MFWFIGRFNIFLLVHYLPVLHTLYHHGSKYAREELGHIFMNLGSPTADLCNQLGWDGIR